MEYSYLIVNKIKIYGFETVTATKEDVGIPYDVILISSQVDKSDLGDPVLHVVIDNFPVPIRIAKSHHKIYYYVIPEAPVLLQWVRKHYKHLMEHWKSELTDKQILNYICIKNEEEQ